MIKCIDWGQHLRLGNYLFMYTGIQSAIVGTGNKFVLPSSYFLWKYLQNPPELTDDKSFDEVFHTEILYTDQRKEQMHQVFKLAQEANKVLNVNIGGNLQSEKWFIDNIDYIKSLLTIKPECIEAVKQKYAHIFTKPTIGIGIRRGDFINHGVFYQIPETWYEKVLNKHFPDWEQSYNVVIFSDHIEWCKVYYQARPFFFADANNTHTHEDSFKHYHNDPMDQFILGALMDNFIGGSSTFSWWQMWFVKNFNNGSVIHSGKNLSDAGNREFGENKDYYPETWAVEPVE